MTDVTLSPVAESAVSIGPEARRALIRLLRVAYPHSSFPDGPYERTADAVIAKVADSVYQGLLLGQGLASLDAAARRAAGTAEGTSETRFVDLADDAALSLLRDIAGADFFQVIRSVAVVSLYNDQETWSLLGYQGPSFDVGGYLDRGFDDLDWLPNPRIEEYDGPEELVEVAPHDEPATTGGGTK